MPTRRAATRPARRSCALLIGALTAGCVAPPAVRARDAGRSDASALDTLDAAARDADVSLDAAALGAEDARAPDDAAAPDAAPLEPCVTRVTYGEAWIHPSDHPADFDDVPGEVTWDGVCHPDGDNTFAQLSNGWRPYFSGRSACVIALDRRGACAARTDTCTTQVSYGPSWLRAPDHPDDFDRVAGVVTWSGECRGESGGRSSALLSNGWRPYFQGGCEVSILHQGCGGLFTNPVVDTDCPDPGVVHDGARYVMACTGGDFVLRTSADLVHWIVAGSIFAPGRRPTWATGDFWAPEIHRAGAQWVAYFSARHQDGSLAVGAATGPTALGPFTDLGQPLVHDPRPGVIDAHHFTAPDGGQYLLWKLDGNAVGAPTPIYGQALAADGVTLQGERRVLISGDLPWEGGLVEGPWMIFEDGRYYLFYSANGYATPRYAVGVARADAPLGPFTKLGPPILGSQGAFAGPGHGAVVRGPSGDWVHVYHAWSAGHVGQPPGRMVLVDRLRWADGWPHQDSAPSARAQPPP